MNGFLWLKTLCGKVSKVMLHHITQKVLIITI